MANDFGNGLDFSLPASADLSASQYCFVSVNSSAQLALGTRGVLAAGVLQDGPAAAGRAGRVRPNGVTKVVYGGSVTAGQALVSDANGKAVNASSADNDYMGIALVSGSSGDVGEMLLQPRGLS